MTTANFIYERGRVQRTQYWHRPSLQGQQQFLLEVLPELEKQAAELWVTGKVLRDPANTWDFDCFFTAAQPAQTIEDLQHYLLDTGFKYDMLVDPYWVSAVPQAVKKQNRWHNSEVKVWLLYPVRYKNRARDTTTDWRGQPGVPQITEYLVEFDYGRSPIPQKHWSYLDKHGDFQKILARDYLVSLGNSEKVINKP